MSMPPFHLAFPVHDLDAAREFYGGLLQCPVGRSDEQWVDFDLYGHQIVAHLSPDAQAVAPHLNAVDGKAVPVPHFGVVLPWAQWESLASRMEQAGTCFVVEPYVRFAGQPGEQATMFFLDPSGNALEFKAFRDPEDVFRKE